MLLRWVGDLRRSCAERVRNRKAERRAKYTAQILATFTPPVAENDELVAFLQKLPFFLAVPFFYFVGWAYVSDYLRAFNIRMSSVDTDINQIFVYAFLSVVKHSSLFIKPIVLFIGIFILASQAKYFFSTIMGKLFYTLISLGGWILLAWWSVQAISVVAIQNAAAIPQNPACKVLLVFKDEAKDLRDALPPAVNPKYSLAASIYEAKDKIFVYARDPNQPTNAVAMVPGRVYEVRKELIESITHHTSEGGAPCAG
jgi:hypothetical protein